jgi:hypothetical protein
MELIPRQEITSCAKCPFLRCRLHKKYECFISTAEIGGVEEIQGIDKDCPLEDVPEPKESNYTDKPVQPCPDCVNGKRKIRLGLRRDVGEFDCPTCKPKEPQERWDDRAGEAVLDNEPQVENPDNCAIHCVLLREVDGVLDRFNATKGNENELCLFCHSKKYDTDGIIHIRGCIIRKLREGYEAGRKDKLGG